MVNFLSAFISSQTFSPAPLDLFSQIHSHYGWLITGHAGKEDSGVMSTVDMGASYQQSGQQQATEQKLSSIMDSLRAREKTAGVSVSQPVSYATNFFWQVSHVCRVAMVQSWSNR